MAFLQVRRRAVHIFVRILFLFLALSIAAQALPIPQQSATPAANPTEEPKTPAPTGEQGKFILHKFEQPIGEETYQITLGGSADEQAAIGQIVGPGFSSENVVEAIETIVDTYIGLRRDEAETFVDAFRRVGIAPFKEALYERSAGSDI